VGTGHTGCAWTPLSVFADCETSTVSDALDEHGLEGVITGLEPAAPGHRAVGRARTIGMERSDAEDTGFPFEMLGHIAAADVLVIAGVSPDISCWGGLASQLAANARMGGTIVDGGYRDVGEIRAGAYPVFGRQPTPKSGQGRIDVAAAGEPVTVGDTRVRPGDVVVADATGVVVVPADHEAAVAETAAAIRDRERERAAAVDDGATVADLRDEFDRF